jgi:hypothetical protein
MSLNNKYLLRRFKGAWGSLFSFTTQKTPKPVTAPNVKNPDQRSGLLLKKKPDLIGAIQPCAHYLQQQAALSGFFTWSAFCGQAQGMAVAVGTVFVGLLHNMQNYGAVPRPLDKWW